MALSYVKYNGNGSTTNFALGFPYINDFDVEVYLDGVLQTLTTDYTWFNADTISMNTAPLGGGTPEVLWLKRVTQNTARLVDFQDAGNLTEATMDTDSNQLFFLMQESVDSVNDNSMTLDTDSKWDGESNIIKNVADPTANQDVATKLWSETSSTSTLAACLVAQVAAELAETNAETAETAAELAETNVAADLVLTNADVVLTNADVVLTNADVVLTGADLALTNADVVATNQDTLDTAADLVATNQDTIDTAADLVLTNADVVLTNADVVLTGLDVVDTGADVTAAAASAAAAAASAASIDTAAFTNRRNLIINGNCVIAQRGTTVASGYFMDRFETLESSGAVLSVYNTQDATAGRPFDWSAEVDVVTADASFIASEYAAIRTQIEGYDFARARWGTADATSVTISFWTRHSSTGTYGVALNNSAANRSIATSYTQSVADVWEYQTVVFAGDTSGTWLTDEGIGVNVYWSYAVGSNWVGTADTWEASDSLGVTGQTVMIDTIGKKFRIADMQLELGTDVTDFELRSYQEELALCQRYYEVSYDIASPAATVTELGKELIYSTGLTSTAHTTGSRINFAVAKRDAPTVTLYSPVTGASGKARDYISNADVTSTASSIGEKGCVWSGTMTATGTAIFLGAQWTAESEL